MTANRSDPAAKTQAVETALGEASSTIDAARTLLGQGRLVDLNGLENRIDQACKDLFDLPRSDREKLKPALVTLIDALNTLSDALTAQHKDVSDTLKGINSRQTAVSAYKPR